MDKPAARIGIDTPEKTRVQAEFLYNRLCKRFRHLKKWARRSGINAFRLYDRDIPEIPLVLELYDDAVSGALYSRPYEKDEGEEEAWLLAMRAEISRALGIPEDRVFLKERQRMRQRREAGNQYGKMSGRNFYREVREGDMIFRVNLSDYIDTGLFLDARKKRALIRSLAEGKDVLNLFSYTCSLSAAAAKGGARKVDSVDLSATYLEWGKVNFALNGLGVPDAEGAVSGPYSFTRSDVRLFLGEAVKKNLRWDIIILDAPSFSNSKKTQGTLDIRRDYVPLINMSLALLSPGGTLYFSSNARAFKLDTEMFPAYDVKDISSALVDEDFFGKKNPVNYLFTREKRK